MIQKRGALGSSPDTHWKHPEHLGRGGSAQVMLADPGGGSQSQPLVFVTGMAVDAMQLLSNP